MKIAINALALTPGPEGSAGGQTFLTNLVAQLAKIDKENKYYLYLSKASKNYFDRLVGPNFKKIVFPFHSHNKYLKFLFEHFLIPFYNLRFKIDVLFCPSNLAPLFPATKLVLAVQSLHYKYAPEVMPWVRRIYHRILLPHSLRKARKVIAVSQSLKSLIGKIVQLSLGKIEVIYEGVDLESFDKSKAQKSFATQNISLPYILFVSTLYRFKNADKLIEAFAKLRKREKISHNLVLIGRSHRSSLKELKKIVARHNINQSVVFLGHIEKKEILASFYSYAELFVYPSSVETFGLPPLEAMACGTPVVGSDKTSVPEIIGDAGLIVDPNNIENLSKTIYKVLTNKGLRNSLIKRGYERVRNFSWEKTAQKTLEVFQKVYNEK